MPRPYASAVIDRPADEVWTLVRDFGSLAVWNSGAIERCEIEGGLAGDQVGAVRGLWLADGTYVSERLVSHSDLERSYQYDFQSKPFEIEDYLSTVRITPVTDGDRAFAEWFATFSCDRGASSELTGLFANVVYQGGLMALKAHLEA